MKRIPNAAVLAVAVLAFSVALCSCSTESTNCGSAPAPAMEDAAGATQDETATTTDSEGSASATEDVASKNPAEIRAQLNIVEDFHDEFIHGDKPADCQRYIVMHDTEGTADAATVIAWWASNGKRVASHFVVNTDGSIVQCVPMDSIAHHAGFGDNGHNQQYGVEDESRDDKIGTVSIGPEYSDYGMNSYSVGIEMVHMGESGEEYPEAQLKAVDGLIAYIDAYYGSQSTIIDHKMWRTTNSDCSEQFEPYLRNLQNTRTHDGS